MLNAKSTAKSGNECLLLQPRKLISLWEMVQYLAVELVQLLDRLSSESDHAFINASDDKYGPTKYAVPEDKQRLLSLLNEVDRHCENIGLVKVKGRIKPFKHQLGNEGECSYAIITDEVLKLRRVISGEIRERTFAFIPTNKAIYFEKDSLFGESVNQSFPSAAIHIKSAGNCLAADLHTAAVYHLMCVAELGLRALAKCLHVSKVKKTMPIELGTWEDIISALEVKVNGRFPRTRKGQQDSDFYKSAFIEYRAFKDFWRNKVMHSRVQYGGHDALSAFEHVRAFMQRLAQRVSEN